MISAHVGEIDWYQTMGSFRDTTTIDWYGDGGAGNAPPPNQPVKIPAPQTQPQKILKVPKKVTEQAVFDNVGGMLAPAPKAARNPAYVYPTFPVGGDMIQSAFWPGVPRVDSMSYTVSHSIQAGVITLVTYTEDDDVDPAPYGNLVVTDGRRTVTVRDCKLDKVHVDEDGSGRTITITLLDRRWRWRNQWGGLGGISGRYNQTDDRGMLIPWSIRSPEELARLCLARMNEVNYKIDMPDGLKKSAGDNIDRYLRLGESFPRSDTNPRVEWDHTPPAEALANLAAMFGCRVVYQPVSDRVQIVQQGSGLSALPDWPFEMVSPNVELPQMPSAIGVYGAPIRFQYFFLLEPVGPEWDGAIVPINDLSYRPLLSGWPSFAGPDPRNPWESCAPPYFGEVRATDRLAHVEASHLAAQAIWKWYRVKNADYRDPKKPISLPGFGPVKRLNQLVFQPSKVEQLIPTARVKGGFDKSNFSDPKNPLGILPDFYNGRSRDRAATVTGSVHILLGQVIWAIPSSGASQNTPPGTRVYSDFAIETDPLGNQLVKFGERVYFYSTRGGGTGFAKAPALTLETAVLVTDPETDQLVRYEAVLPLPGGTAPPEWHAHPDLQVGILPASAGTPSGGNPGKTTITWVPATETDVYGLRVSVNWRVNEKDYSVTAEDTTVSSMAVRFSLIQNQLRADANFAKFFTVNFSGHVLTIDGNGNFPFNTASQGLNNHPPGPDPPDLFTAWNTTVVVVGKADTDTATTRDWKYAEGDIEYATQAALTYLLGHAKKYVVVGGDNRQYIGIYPLDPDGSVHQVTWSIGGNGPTTVACLNNERSAVVPPYPVRRRAELLPPNKLAAEANRAEDKLFPRTGSSVK